MDSYTTGYVTTIKVAFNLFDNRRSAKDLNSDDVTNIVGAGTLGLVGGGAAQAGLGHLALKGMQDEHDALAAKCINPEDLHRSLKRSAGIPEAELDTVRFGDWRGIGAPDPGPLAIPYFEELEPHMPAGHYGPFDFGEGFGGKDIMGKGVKSIIHDGGTPLSPSVMAHEMGHVADARKAGPRALKITSALAPRGLGTLAALGMAASGNETAADMSPYVAGASFVPQLAEELNANVRASKYLRDLRTHTPDMSVSRIRSLKTLLPAFGTYALGAAMPVAASAGLANYMKDDGILGEKLW